MLKNLAEGCVDYRPNLELESVTGDQDWSYRKWRGRWREPSWRQVDELRKRWTASQVADALTLIRDGATTAEVSLATGFKPIDGVADLRGLDVILLPPAKLDSFNKEPLIANLERARLDGARLTGLNLSLANLGRANLRKATLRRTNLAGANLTKCELEDADLRDANILDTKLAHIRYTEDGFLQRGTVLMETNIQDARYVDPLLTRCANDQYYLYVMKYKYRRNFLFRIFFFLWWITCNYGKSIILWGGWSLFMAIGFASIYFYILGEGAFAISGELPWQFSTMLYYSVVTFTTLGFGDVLPNTTLAAWCVMAEVILGYVMLGGLISILATKLARRS